MSDPNPLPRGTDTSFFITYGIVEQHVMMKAEELVRSGKVVEIHYHAVGELCEPHYECRLPLVVSDE